MNRGNPNRYADRIVFWVCLFLLIGCVTQATYQVGVEHGRQSCRPSVEIPKKSGYEMNKRQLRRMIRYEQSKVKP